MSLKNLLNKITGKQSSIDVTNLSLRDLKKGYIIDYFMESWVVKEVYEYDWGNNFFSKEYKISSGKADKYLHVEDEGTLKISISEEINPSEFDKNLKQDIVNNDKPSNKLIYKGKEFNIENENMGYYRNFDEDYKSEFVSWEYVDNEQKEFISVMRWGETDITASFGQFLEEYEFSNIIPA